MTQTDEEAGSILFKVSNEFLILFLMLSTAFFMYPSVVKSLIFVFEDALEQIQVVIDTPKLILQQYENNRKLPPPINEEDESYFSVDSEDESECSVIIKRNAPLPIKKILVDQDTQVSEIDFQTMDLRVKQPFRHKYNYETKRTDFNGDIQDRIGRNPPAPLKSITRRKKFLKVETPSALGLLQRTMSISPLAGTPTPKNENEMYEDDTVTDDQTETESDLVSPSQRALESNKELDEDDTENLLTERDLDMEQTTAKIRTERISSIDSGDFESWVQESKSVDTKASIQITIQRLIDQIKKSNLIEEPRVQITKDLNQSLVSRSLSIIPTQLMGAIHVTTLDLSQNQLTMLPNWFCDTLVSLTSLNLSHNSFFDLPEKFAALKNLKELDLSYNKFEYIPSSLLSSNVLGSIDISHNSLLTIQYDVQRLRSTLTELNISYNSLTELPDDLRHMKRLRYFKFSENNLSFHTLNSITSKINLEEPKPKITNSFRSNQRSNSIVGPRASISTDIPKEILESTSTNLSASLPILTTSSSSFNDHLTSSHHHQPTSTITPSASISVPPRILLLLELLESERKYVRYLNVFHEMYHIPLTVDLKTTSTEHDFFVSESDIDIIIPETMPAILTFERSFYVELRTRISQEISHLLIKSDSQDDILISDLFSLRSIHFTKLYTCYPDYLDRSLELLREIKHDNFELDKYFKQLSRLPLCEGMTIENLLILPTTRIARLCFLLQNIYNHTPTSNPDRRGLQSALKMLRSCEKHWSESMRQVNNKHKMIDVARRLKMTDLCTPGRFLIREGKLLLSPNKGIGDFKKELAKQFSKKEVSVGGLNPYWEMMKNRLSNIHGTGTDMGSIWEVRLTEESVTVFLFSDVVVIKDNNLIHKLVARPTLYELRGAKFVNDECVVDGLSPREGEALSTSAPVGNTVYDVSVNEDCKFYVELSNKRRLAFVAESAEERASWVNDFSKVISDLGNADNSDSSEGSEDDELELLEL
ncbi:hypothetical protein AKO1_014189 [Acrasis kona]|uniref:Uncharacterized protein n=1 Tax=Acrasis kona TaxID=1008807 RepID=A0AAW2Z2B2_9EUKA